MEQNINITPTPLLNNSNEIELNSLSYNSFSLGRLDTDNIPMSDLKQYVKYPMIYNEILRTISEQAYNAQGIYSNTIDYSISTPILSSPITTMRNKTPELKEKKKMLQEAITTYSKVLIFDEENKIANEKLLALQKRSKIRDDRI